MLAMIEGPPATINAYMYGDWKVTHYETVGNTIYSYIEGSDPEKLWSYIEPRLESGLYFGLVEVTGIPDTAEEWDND